MHKDQHTGKADTTNLRIKKKKKPIYDGKILAIFLKCKCKTSTVGKHNRRANANHIRWCKSIICFHILRDMHQPDGHQDNKNVTPLPQAGFPFPKAQSCLIIKIQELPWIKDIQLATNLSMCTSLFSRSIIEKREMKTNATPQPIYSHNIQAPFLGVIANLHWWENFSRSQTCKP